MAVFQFTFADSGREGECPRCCSARSPEPCLSSALVAGLGGRDCQSIRKSTERSDPLPQLGDAGAAATPPSRSLSPAG